VSPSHAGGQPHKKANLLRRGYTIAGGVDVRRRAVIDGVQRVAMHRVAGVGVEPVAATLDGFNSA